MNTMRVLLFLWFLILINFIATSARSVHEYSKLGTNGGTNCAGKYNCYSYYLLVELEGSNFFWLYSKLPNVHVRIMYLGSLN